MINSELVIFSKDKCIIWKKSKETWQIIRFTYQLSFTSKEKEIKLASEKKSNAKIISFKDINLVANEAKYYL